jgi:hypothetical protein
MVAMKKIHIKLFDGRRNQNFWFHFCYIQRELWDEFKERFKVGNMDAQIKLWIAQDFGLVVLHMNDLHEVKNLIKERYSELYPDIYLESEGDRQGWVRVWLTDKMKRMLEENNG